MFLFRTLYLFKFSNHFTFILFTSSNDQGWSYFKQKEFTDNYILFYKNNSNDQENSEGYCECVLEKTISEYPNRENALKIDVELF